jgi:hypothetical protein
VYVLANSRAATIVDSVGPHVERAIADDLAWLGETFTGPRLTLFVVGTRAQMKSIIGETYGGFPVFDEHAAFFVGSDSAAPALRHELMHLFTWQFWGTPASNWLSEGIPMLMMPRCGGAYATTMAAELDREGKFIPLETLWHNFQAKGEVGTMYYAEAASLIAYIDKRWGRAKLRAFWPIGAYKNIQTRLGVDVPTLERDWRASLKLENPKATWKASFADITRRGCE